MRQRIHLTESQLYDTIHAMVNEALVKEGVLGNFLGGVASDVKGRWNDAHNSQRKQEQQKKIQQMVQLIGELWESDAFDNMKAEDRRKIGEVGIMFQKLINDSYYEEE